MFKRYKDVMNVKYSHQMMKLNNLKTNRHERYKVYEKNYSIRLSKYTSSQSKSYGILPTEDEIQDTIITNQRKQIVMDEKTKNWINATKRAQQLEIVNKIEEFQKELHKGKIDFEEFFHKVSMFKHDLENGILLTKENKNK